MDSNYLLKYRNLKFKKLTANDGLSSDHVFTAFEDSRGFIWFGALDGLNRYDGKNFKVYKNDLRNENSISHGFVIPIIEDSDKKMWVGVIDGGLCMYVKEKDNFIRYVNDPGDPFSISDNNVTDIIEDEEGILWVGTQKGVLNKFDKQTGRFYHYKFPLADKASIFENLIMRLFIDSKNNLWVCTGGGLKLFDKETGQFQSYRNDANDRFSLSCNDVRGIYEDDKGILWIATNGGGLNKFDSSKGIFEKYCHDPKNSHYSCPDYLCDICPDNSGMFWLASLTNSGQGIFDPVSETFINYKHEVTDEYSINNNGVVRIFKDSSGTMWLSTRGFGVYYYSEHNWKFQQYFNDSKNPDSLSSNHIGAMCQDKNDNLWISTNKGMDIFSKDFRKQNDRYGNPELLNTLLADDSLRMFCGISGKVWISHGEREGLIDMYDDETNQFIRFDNNLRKSISCLLEDSEGLLWVVYVNYGLKVFNKERTSWKKYEWTFHHPREIDIHTFYSIAEDNESNIWLGSFGLGILILNKKSGIFTSHVNNPEDINSLTNSQILHPIYKDRRGFIWIGTIGHGLDKYDPGQNKFTHYTKEQGLSNNDINGILEDENGNLWISTYKEISKFNPETETFRNFDINDGVLVDEFSSGSALKTRDGKMYFGGANGLIGFYPDMIPENKKIPDIVLTGFRIFNQDAALEVSISEAEQINLSYKENFFSIDYAALDFINPWKNQYAYKLEGVDKNWNYVGNTTTANYTDISPGSYVFRVKGSNNDGVWNEEGTSVRIKIKPPFYKTLWFEGLSALSMIGGISFLVRQRFQKEKKERIRQEEFTKKIIESQENERKRFASELHDGLGQDLIVIKNKAQISFDKTEEFSKLKEQMLEISELASLTIAEAREISQSLRPSILDTLGLTKSILSMLDRAENSTNISFLKEIDDIDNVFTPGFDINVYRILQECLTNAIKHSNASAIIVKISKLGKEILINVWDDGKGFDISKITAEGESTGFGLKGIPERVKLFGGSFKIFSRHGEGTKITIILPAKN